ncbi:hypothetical protein BSKO_08435 [Bryopsis sp. KO-2023]|nr:hypothetical protein BSKO_08435 [Bryopsis sp. KO-2023]
MGAYLSTPVTEKEAFDGEIGDVKYGGASMQGWRRNMEDAHVVFGEEGGDDMVSVFGVFDGHGGSEVARFCQEHLAKELLTMDGFSGNVEESLVKVFHRIDDMLRDSTYHAELEEFKNKPECDEPETTEEGGTQSSTDAVLKQLNMVRKMMFANSGGRQGGTANGGNPGNREGEGGGAFSETGVHAGSTAIVAVKKGKTLYIANAGDSRGVLCRGNAAVALSEDHKPSLERERARIVAAGGFLSEIAGMCRVNGNLNLSRAIGDLKYKGNSSFKPKDQIITAEPDVKVVDLSEEDKFFVLACDGVWDVMDNQQVVEFVATRHEQGKKYSEIGAELLNECLAPDPKLTRGVGCDNMTILIGGLQPPKPPAAT